MVAIQILLNTLQSGWPGISPRRQLICSALDPWSLSDVLERIREFTDSQVHVVLGRVHTNDIYLG
jgi:hypothetical protein